MSNITEYKQAEPVLKRRSAKPPIAEKYPKPRTELFFSKKRNENTTAIKTLIVKARSAEVTLDPLNRNM